MMQHAVRRHRTLRLVPFDAPACPQDGTGAGNLPDGNVNIDDLLLVVNNYGACPSLDPCPADNDYNCVVDIDDLLAVINAWGPCPAFASTPVPQGILDCIEAFEGDVEALEACLLEAMDED